MSWSQPSVQWTPLERLGGEGLVRGSRGLWGRVGQSQGHTGLPKSGLWMLTTLDIPACTVPKLIPHFLVVPGGS